MKNQNSATGLSLEELELEFLRLWKEGDQRPKLGNLIGKVEPEIQDEALKILIPIDLQFRFESGDDCRLDDYSSLGANACGRQDARLSPRWLPHPARNLCVPVEVQLCGSLWAGN